ncbi:glutamate--tRNA ligase [Candidatus Roizmanbacteria bacterium]|nr:glutamate--tRNA ligase [Candidatus Roizmanbacteria bacterium]
MVRTRIAPSPTGEDIHIGNLYTALINYAFAKKHAGQFIIRIEDTDRERYVDGSEDRVLQTIKSYGIIYDEGPDIGGPYAPYKQSERLSLYKKYAEQLVEKGAAYYCFCSKERLDEIRKKQIAEKRIPKYDRHCRDVQSSQLRQGFAGRAEFGVGSGEKYVIRLKVPDDRDIVFADVIRGKIIINSNTLDDQVLLKSDGYPTYHLAVVVDDNAMKITHVIRAEEWINSTPKHILLYEAFGWELPIFTHLPILRNPDRSKLSKRKNPVWAAWYLEQGFLPEAVLNYLSLMGWSHPEQKEIFSLAEFIEKVDLKNFQPVGPSFDIVKLEWMNGEYIRKTQNSKLRTKIFEYYNKQYPENIIEKTIPLIKERIKKLSDYLPLCEFFFKRPEKHEIDLSNKRDLLKKMHDALLPIEQWNNRTIGDAMQELAKREGVRTGEFFMILRVATTGKKISPPLNESMEILGKQECLMRVKALS